MRVLIVGLRWPPETFLAALIEGLVDTGIDVTVASSTRPEERLLERKGFHWLFVPEWAGPAPRRFLRLLVDAAFGCLRRSGDLRRMSAEPRLRHVTPDALRLWNRVIRFAGRRWDVMYFPWTSGAISRMPLLRLGMPCVISCRGSQVLVAPHDPGNPVACADMARVFERATAVHCVSEGMAKEAAKYGLEPRKATVIPPAVDPSFFTPGPPSDHTPTDILRIVTTGSLLWLKGYEYALTALRIFLDTGARAQLEILGDGRDRQRLLYTVADLGLEQHVRLAGRQSREAVRDRLQHADVFLLSSLSEGISNGALEAMACAIPVVTTDCGSMTEAIADGCEGLVVPVRDPQSMAAALLRLSTDVGVRRAMGDAGRQRVLKEFTLSRQVERFAEMLVGAAR